MHERKGARAARAEAAHARGESLSDTAATMTDTIVDAVDADTAPTAGSGYTTIAPEADQR